MANTQYKKVVLYADEAKYRELRSILARIAKPVSEWFREKVEEELKKSDNNSK